MSNTAGDITWHGTTISTARRLAAGQKRPNPRAGHEEEHMHTLVVQMSTDPARAEEVARHIREDVAGWAKRQPGFLAGQWLRSPDGRAGMGVVVFASEDAAISAAQGPRSYPRDDGRAWNIEDVTVYQQLTTA